MDRIVLQQVRERPGVSDVIDCYELQSAIFKRYTKCISTDATKPVDRSLNRHTSLLLLEVTTRRRLFQWTNERPQGIPLEGKPAPFYTAFDPECQSLRVNLLEFFARPPLAPSIHRVTASLTSMIRPDSTCRHATWTEVSDRSASTRHTRVLMTYPVISASVACVVASPRLQPAAPTTSMSVQYFFPRRSYLRRPTGFAAS